MAGAGALGGGGGIKRGNHLAGSEPQCWYYKKEKIFWSCSTSHLVLYDSLLPGWRFESQHCIVL